MNPIFSQFKTIDGGIGQLTKTHFDYYTPTGEHKVHQSQNRLFWFHSMRSNHATIAADRDESYLFLATHSQKK